MTDKPMKVVLSDQVKEAFADADPEMQEALTKMFATMKAAAEAVDRGEFKTMEEAIAASDMQIEITPVSDEEWGKIVAEKGEPTISKEN